MLRQEDHEFEVSLGIFVIPVLDLKGSLGIFVIPVLEKNLFGVY
jgi:hypothetical protein